MQVVPAGGVHALVPALVLTLAFTVPLSPLPLADEYPTTSTWREGAKEVLDRVREKTKCKSTVGDARQRPVLRTQDDEESILRERGQGEQEAESPGKMVGKRPKREWGIRRGQAAKPTRVNKRGKLFKKAGKRLSYLPLTSTRLSRRIPPLYT